MSVDDLPLRIKPMIVASTVPSRELADAHVDPSAKFTSDDRVGQVAQIDSPDVCDRPSDIPLVLKEDPNARILSDFCALDDADRESNAHRRRQFPLGIAALTIVFLLLLLWIVNAAWNWAVQVGGTHPILGFVCGLLLIIGAALMMAMLVRETRSYLRLRHLGDLQIRFARARAGRIVTADDEKLKVDFRSFVEKLKANGTISDDVKRSALTLLADARNPGEWVAGACSDLLSTMDVKVKSLIEREARLVGVSTALSPSGPLDTAIALWRNSRLVFQIAAIYGVRPHGYQSFRLLRRVVFNTVVAGLSQEAMQMLYAAYGPAAVEAASRGFRSIFDLIYRGGMMWATVEPVSGGLLAAGGAFGKGASDFAGAAAAQVTGPLLQGLLNSILTIRVGLVAQNECRLLAMTDDERRIESASIISTLLGFFLSVRRGTGTLASSTQDNRDEVSK